MYYEYVCANSLETEASSHKIISCQFQQVGNTLGLVNKTLSPLYTQVKCTSTQ